MNKTGIIWDERYCQHKTGMSHPECPERLNAIKEVLNTDLKLQYLNPRPATFKEVGFVHTNQHIKEVDAIKDYGYFDGDTPYSPGSKDAAFLAAGGVLEAVDQVENKKIDNAFCFIRPPGHHAEKNHAMGFCLFNNVAVAAENLVHQFHKKRIAIIDIDVHHGNGTQHSFYDRSDVFYISSHRYPFYPGTGSESEKGVGQGLGFTLNVPLEAYSDDDDYKKAYQEIIVPALINYNPEFVLVSAGFDAHEYDPLGGMKVTKNGFKMMADELFKVAKKCCDSKIVFVLEGGYDMDGLRQGVEATFEVIR